MHHLDGKDHKFELRRYRSYLANHKKSKSCRLLFIVFAVDTYTQTHRHTHTHTNTHTHNTHTHTHTHTHTYPYESDFKKPRVCLQLPPFSIRVFETYEVVLLLIYKLYKYLTLRKFITCKIKACSVRLNSHVVGPHLTIIFAHILFSDIRNNKSGCNNSG